MQTKIIFQDYKFLVFLKLVYDYDLDTSAKAQHLKVLDAMHHAGIRIPIGAFCSSLVENILADAGEISRDLHFQSLLVRIRYCIQRLLSS